MAPSSLTGTVILVVIVTNLHLLRTAAPGLRRAYLLNIAQRPTGGKRDLLFEPATGTQETLLPVGLA